MDGLIHAASSPTLLSAPCKLWAGGKAIGRLKLVLCYVEILTYCWNTQNNRPVAGWFDTYQLTQLTLSSQRAVEVENLWAVEKPIHTVGAIFFENHIINHDFLSVFKLGLPTSTSIFSAISASILKISVPINKRRSWRFRNTPKHQLSDEYWPRKW